MGSIDHLLPAESSSAAETERLGARLARLLRPGDVVALYGDLGAGKTHLSKGLCAGLDIDPARVTSPTFTIVNEYHGRLPVYHVDAYRINHLEEFFELGYDTFFFGDGLTIIEWPSRVEALIPAGAIRLRLTHAGGDQRRIEHVPDGAPA